MIGLVCALPSEAAAMVRLLALKKQAGWTPFTTYEGPGHRLVVSGVGKVRAAAATAYLLGSELPWKWVLLNFGVAGGGSDLAIGQACLAHKVVDHSTGSVYYPDLLVRHPWQEETLVTHDRPVFETGQHRLVDMEASGFMDTALRYLSSGQLAVVKVVSDHFRRDGPIHPEELLARHAQQLADHLLALEQLLGALAPALSDDETRLLEEVRVRLRLTVTQARQLEKLALYYKLSGNSDLDRRLAPQLATEVTTKAEARQALSRIESELAVP
ncbi:MAG: hypothetical protein AB7S38_36655 [Vulcanimicrobiota bacterium]